MLFPYAYYIADKIEQFCQRVILLKKNPNQDYLELLQIWYVNQSKN